MKYIAYVVKPDDTLQRIAAYYYADWTLWKWIYGVNNLNNYNLQAGSVIKIPYPITEDNIHKVKEKDRYESISLQYYGTELLSEFLKFHNEDIILQENVGREILIPALVNKKVFK